MSKRSDIYRGIRTREDKIRSLENKIKHLKEHSDAEIAKLERKIKNLESERDILKKELLELQKEVKGLRKDSSPKLKALCTMADMCDDVQSMMFNVIFPEDFNPDIFYKVKDIEDKLRKKSERSKRKTWKNLKRELWWDTQHLDTVKYLKRNRNEKAHQKNNLRKRSLMKAVELLKDLRFFKGDLSVEVTNQLITIWGTLKKRSGGSVNGNNRNDSNPHRRCRKRYEN